MDGADGVAGLSYRLGGNSVPDRNFAAGSLLSVEDRSKFNNICCKSVSFIWSYCLDCDPFIVLFMEKKRTTNRYRIKLGNCSVRNSHYRLPMHAMAANGHRAGAQRVDSGDLSLIFEPCHQPIYSGRPDLWL